MPPALSSLVIWLVALVAGGRHVAAGPRAGATEIDMPTPTLFGQVCSVFLPAM